MTAAALLQQANAGYLPGLWMGIALMLLGGVLVVVAAGQIIRWWARRGASSTDDERPDQLLSLRPLSSPEPRSTPDRSGGGAVSDHDVGTRP